MINMYRVHYYCNGPRDNPDEFDRFFVIVQDGPCNPEGKPEVQKRINYLENPESINTLMLEALNYLSGKGKIISVLPHPENLSLSNYYCYWVFLEN